MRKRSIVQAVLAGLFASGIGIAIGLSIDWFPPQASAQAHQVDTLFNVLIVASVPMFVLVTGTVLFSVWSFRMRPGEEDKDGPPIHGNTRLEVVWTALPAIMLVSLCSYAFVVLRDFEKVPAGHEINIDVTSQQFAWSFSYPSSVTGGRPMGSTELYLPQGQPVQFHVRSKDVLHAFYVPAFRLQIDAVPGQTDDVRATPTRLGSYPLECAELCGLGHSTMRSTVHVVTPAAFAAWLKGKQAPVVSSTAGPGALAAAGRSIFIGSGGCGACHKLADASTTGQVGPNLGTAIAPDARKRGLARAAFVRESIVSPNAYISPGFPANVMPPSFGSTLSRSQIDALVAYLVKATKGP
jgi:cytochrome c oxidase subunit II